MRWGIEKRLEFIEFRLFWEGGINRADIIDEFGVSVPQASKDLALYEEKAPGNLAYDKSAKRYHSSSQFKPVFIEPDANLYLAQLRASGLSAKGGGWVSVAPSVDVLPIPNRQIDVDVLRGILTAVRSNRSIELRYQSMSPDQSAPRWRWITPHALGHDGMRWHTRAFCHEDRKFKDFILSRCLDRRQFGEPQSSGRSDGAWNQVFDVILKPNPALSEGQQAVVAQDYRMTKGQVNIPVRKALLYYFQKRLRLDVAEAHDRPQETPIIVANRPAFEAALTEAMA